MKWYYSFVAKLAQFEEADNPMKRVKTMAPLGKGSTIDLSMPGRGFTEFQFNRLLEIMKREGFECFVNLLNDCNFDGSDKWSGPRKPGPFACMWKENDEYLIQRIGQTRVLTPIIDSKGPRTK